MGGSAELAEVGGSSESLLTVGWLLLVAGWLAAGSRLLLAAGGWLLLAA